MSWLKSKQVWKRTISVITILALLITAMPVSLAAGNDSGKLDSINRVAAGDFIAPEGESEATPTLDVPTDTPEPTPTETPVVTPEPAASTDPSATPEETVTPEPSLSPSPSPLPYGFAGMPEGYVLSANELDAKEIMSEKDILSTTESLTAGEDYVPNQIMFWADSQEYAETVAAAYSGVLLSYSDHIAVVELQTATVVEALSVASDMTTMMPAVDANQIIRLDPDEMSNSEIINPEMRAQALAPRLQTWYDKPNDPYLKNPDSYNYQWMHDAVNTYEAWGVTTGSSSIKVAVIDSGVMKTHEDLAGKVTIINMSDVTGFSGDYTVAHGTHVAGIIAATAGNGKGGAGIAPGVSILSLAVLTNVDGNGGAWGTAAAITYGINRAVSNGAQIINMSIGGYGYNSTYNAAIQNAINHNVTVIAAMGNDGSNSMEYPAAYSNVIAVSAVGSDFRRANFSNYGSWADIAAPGVDILSSVTGSTSAYDSYQGTSMAAPVVSGVAALYMSKAGWVSPSAMEKKLESCVNKSGSSSIGAGVIDAAKLFAADKTAPAIIIKDSLSNVITSFTYPIPLESTLTITQAPGATNAKMILYTLDGTTPSVSNGEVKNGSIYSGVINLAGMQAGKAITVKAMCISGMGIASSVATVKFTLAQSSSISSVSISGVSKITAGASTTFVATVNPASSVSQKVTWEILATDSGMQVSISSSGVLKTVANSGGTVVIRATSMLNPAKYMDKHVTVEAIPFIKTVTLNATKLSLTARSGYTSNSTLSIYGITNAAGGWVDPTTVLRTWSSSNTKVATVDQNGVVKAVGKGTASIKCLVLDGSNKSAVCSVTVSQLSESISVAGQLSIPTGKTATYKATILPSTVNTKSVVWSLIGAPSGVTISSSGVVSVPSYVWSGTFTVRATAVDGTGLYADRSVSIVSACTSVKLTSSDYRIVRNSYSTILSAMIFSFNIDSTASADNILQLGYSIEGNSTTPLWSSGSPTIASVDQTGKVTGLKAGSTTITCAAQDGSGKKATMKVTVVVPNSKISIATSAPLSMSASPTLACGKSATNTLVFGDTYGAPTVKNVAWSFQVYELDYSDGSLTDCTDYFKGNKRVTLSSSGKLSLSSSMYYDWMSIPATCTFVIFVYADALDGSGVYGSIVYYVQPATSYMVAKYSSYAVASGDGADLAFFSSYYGSVSNYRSDFSVTSSNPAVAGYADSISKGADNLYYASIYGGLPGTAIITIKSNDGSGKSCSIKVYVY